MSIIQSVALLGSAGGAGGAAAFTIDQSLRFRGGQKLTRNIAQNSSGTKVTFSFWVKVIGNPSATNTIFAYAAGYHYFQHISGGSLRSYGGGAANRDTTAKLRDPSAWYHLVIQSGANNSTGNCWLNGVDITSNFSGIDFPSLSFGSSQLFEIGSGPNGANLFNGYLADFICVDGSWQDEDQFGQYNDDAIWVPIDYTGSYGSKGFRLKFDSSGYNGSGGIGADHSGNGNDFTASGFDDGPVGVWSNDVFTTSSSSPDFTSTRQNFFSTQPQTRSFDGNSSTAGQSSGGASDGVYFFRPSTAIPNVTKIEMKPTNGSGFQYHYINGTQGTFSSGAAKQTIYSGSAITLTTVGTDWIAGNTNNGFYQLWINEVEYIDNTDNDVDFLDTPTSNYSTGNAVNTAGSLANANLAFPGSGSYTKTEGTIAYPDSGVFQFECEIVGNSQIHIGYRDQSASVISSGTPPTTQAGHWFVVNNGNYFENGTQFSSAVPSSTDGDIWSFVFDADNSEAKWYLNGTLELTKTIPSGYTFTPFVGTYNAQNRFNFGQMPFLYPVTGASSLQTNNLPEPTIKDGKDHMNSVLWTGDGTNGRDIGGLDFQPDLVWISRRNGNNNKNLYDSVRGVTKHLTPSYNYAVQTTANSLTAFNSDGFQVGTGASDNTSGFTLVGWCWKAGDTASVTYTVKVVSDSGNKYRFDDFGTSAVTLDLEEGGTYVFDQSDSSNSGHPLRFSTTSDGTHGGGSEYTTGVTTTGTPGSAGAKTTITVASGAATLHYYCSVHSGMGGQANTNDTKGSSNFDGTIQSKVTANTDAGFSIVTYTGTGSNATIGHGLTEIPEYVIYKRRDSANGWVIYSSELAATEYLQLHSNAAKQTGSSTMFNSLRPTSSLLNVGTNTSTNASGGSATYVAYCWHSVEGFSKIGSFSGNNSTDGTFVYTNFKPQWLLIKRSSSADHWACYDAVRDTVNPVTKQLNPDLPSSASNGSESDSTNNAVDFLSNGFKLRTSDSRINGSGSTYIYMAFGSNPFGGENAPPVTAR